METDERQFDIEPGAEPGAAQLDLGDRVTVDGRVHRVISRAFSETPSSGLRMRIVTRQDPPDPAAEARRKEARAAQREREQHPSRLDDMGFGFFVPEVRAKELHAEHLRSELLGDIAAYFGRSPYDLVQEANEAQTEYRQRLVFSEPPPFLRWTLQVGDILNNLANTLDYLMWHIAQTQMSVEDPPKPSRIYFPICETPRKFSEWRRGLPWSLSPHLVERLEEWQPYSRETSHSPLRFLNQAGNRNKHRTLIDLSIGTKGCVTASTVPRSAVPTWNRRFPRVINDRDVLAEVMFPTATTGVSIDFTYELQVMVRLPEPDPAFGDYMALDQMLLGARQHVTFAAHELYHDLRLGPR